MSATIHTFRAGDALVVADQDIGAWVESTKQCVFIGARGYPMVKQAKPKAPVPLHHFVLPPKEGFQCDHINRNRADCRRENLRYVTPRQNQWNRGKDRNCTSNFKGVFWDSTKKRWAAAIWHEKKRHRLGTYRVESDAAAAYNKAVLRFRGTFAVLNRAS